MKLRLHAVVTIALALPCAQAGAAVRIAGSDLAAPALEAAVRGGATAPGGDWVLALEGTRPGLSALRAGEADVAVVLLEALPAAQDPDVDYTPIAYRAPVVVVSDRNPVSQIALTSLAAVIGEGENENFRRWSELGLPGEWSARTIAVQVATDQDPLLLDFLRMRVLKAPRLKSSVVATTAAQVLARLREEESALGILPGPPADMTGLKVVPMALSNGGIAFGPTPDNLHAGDYPLRMILAVAVRRDGGAGADDGRRALLSDRVAQALASHGFVPVPAGTRARLSATVSVP